MKGNIQLNDKENLEDQLFAMMQKNLVYNSNFLYYSNKVVDVKTTYNHPDGWLYSDKGTDGKIGYDTDFNSCQINKSNGEDLMTFSQYINEFPRWEEILRDQKVSAIVLIQNPSVKFEITFSLFDGFETSSKTINFNTDETKEVNLDIILSKNAKTLVLTVSCSTPNAVIRIKKVYANLGSIALENLPCMVEGVIGERKQYMSTENPPAEELSLCQESNELSSSQTRLSSFLNGKFGRGSDGLSLLPDMRGYFSRSWDNGATIDPDAKKRKPLGEGKVSGDRVGTVEEDQFKKHKHKLKFDVNGSVTPGTPSPPLKIINTLVSSDKNMEEAGGAETRGKNIAELYTIKWA